MGYWEGNYRCIKENHEFFYNKLKDYDFSQQERCVQEIEVTQSREGSSVLTVTCNNVKERLNSAYAPIKEAQKWVSQYDFDKISIVTTMFGLGNGIQVKELLKQMKQDDILLIYEPSVEIFEYVMHNFDLTEILTDQRLSLTIRGINDYEYENLLMGYVTWINVRSQIICNHTGYDKLFSKQFSWLLKRIHDNNDRAVTNKNTESALSKVFVNNALRNMKYISKSNIITDFLGKIPEEIPAIIVAAGPSLDKNIEELKRAKGKSIILAVDTSLKYLRAHNIEPDFIVTIDPRKDPGHFRSLDFNEIPMFCKVESNPIVLEEHRTRKIFFNLEGYTKDLYEKLGKDSGDLNTGGSVATGAFAICVELGIKHIIMVGLDLAYGNGATHAGGVTKDVSGCGDFLEDVEDINGNLIKTRHDWYEYLNWFNDAVEFYDKGEVIDATEGGAKIKNTKIMSLHDAVDKYCTRNFDVRELLEKLPYTLVNNEVEQYYDILGESVDEIDTINLMIQKGIKICDRLVAEYTRISKESYTSKDLVVRLNDLNGKMEEKSAYLLLDTYCAGTIMMNMAEIYQCRDDVQADKVKIYQKTKVIYEELLIAIKEIKPKLISIIESKEV